VAQPASYVKRFRHAALGTITGTSTSFAVATVPGARMVVYTPGNARSERAIARLAAGEELDARFPCRDTHDEERELVTLAR
jgi:seryl-tRNA synthetase